MKGNVSGISCNSNQIKIEPEKEWFLEYFGKDYWDLVNDSCSSVENTTRELSFIKEILKNHSVDSVLDLCCGIGRHAIPLARAGYLVCALDINEYCLNVAKSSLSEPMGNLKFVQQDIRNICLDQKFDSALLMQTSFGYFTEKENVETIIKIKKYLNTNGILVIDLPNRDEMLKNFVTRYWDRIGETTYLIGHEFDYFKSRRNTILTVIDKGDVREYRHSIRMYTTAEIVYLLRSTGFTNIEIYGDFKKINTRFSNEYNRIQVVAKMGDSLE